MKKIAILGCGWLGFPLAKKLIEKNFEIAGSTTTFEKIDILKIAGVNPFLISVSENGIVGDIIGFLNNASILIIDIPPKLRGLQSENFIKKIKIIIPFIEKSMVKKLIFISSTSVFADDNTTINQFSAPNPDSESGRQLWETETVLQKNSNFATTTIRFGGLVGPDRHPAKMLSGKSNIQNPEAPINLIHQQDCITIIENIIQKGYWNQTINAVAPFHPNRKNYYVKKTQEFGLAPPTFDHSKISVGKTILSDKLVADLEFEFQIVDSI